MKYKKEALFYSIALLVVIIDQLTKLVFDRYFYGKTVPIIKGIFELSVVHNTGAAFGMLKDQLFLLIAFSIIIIFLVIYYFNKTPMKLVPFTALILGGAIGNLIDRMLFGYVVDFLDFQIWPVFNFADSCIVVGALCLAGYLLWKEKSKKK